MSCDWGFCDKPAVGTRVDPDTGAVLPVCVHHIRPTFKLVSNWQDAAEHRRSRLNLAAEFTADGRPWAELDDCGNVVTRTPKQPPTSASRDQGEPS